MEVIGFNDVGSFTDDEFEFVAEHVAFGASIVINRAVPHPPVRETKGIRRQHRTTLNCSVDLYYARSVRLGFSTPIVLLLFLLIASSCVYLISFIASVHIVALIIMAIIISSYPQS